MYDYVCMCPSCVNMCPVCNHMSICVHVCMCPSSVNVCACVHHVRICVHVCMCPSCVYMCVCIYHVCMHVYLCRMCVCAHTYVCVFRNTCIHIPYVHTLHGKILYSKSFCNTMYAATYVCTYYECICQGCPQDFSTWYANSETLHIIADNNTCYYHTYMSYNYMFLHN